MPARKPRPADLAVAGNRMLIAVISAIYAMRYDGHGHFGRALEFMFVSFQVSVATADGHPMTSSQIEKFLGLPHANVQRHLTTLIKIGRVKKVGKRFVADLDYLDSLMSLAHVDRGILTLSECVNEMQRLREALLDVLPP